MDWIVWSWRAFFKVVRWIRGVGHAFNAGSRLEPATVEEAGDFLECELAGFAFSPALALVVIKQLEVRDLLGFFGDLVGHGLEVVPGEHRPPRLVIE